MIKLIASDMDGTLLGNNHTISDQNRDAIKEAQARGVEFIISTGRSFEDARDQVEEAGISCNYLVMNGSELRDCQGNILQKFYLDRDLVVPIVEKLLKEDLSVEVYSTGGIFTLGTTEACKWAISAKINNFFPENSIDEVFSTVEEHFLFKELNRISTIQEVLDKGYEVGKIITFSADKQRIAALRTEIPNLYPVNASGSFAINIEITHLLADKGKAILNYAKLKNIPLENIMTIGDSFNDMSMIDAPFGYTVAMGNAITELKEVAKYITDTNDNDGVGKVIKKYILN